MKVKTIQMKKQKAKEEWKKYIDLLRKERKIKQKKELNELKQLYYHLKRGFKVLNIYQIFKKAGLNKDKLPRMAIARADGKKVYLKISKWNNGDCSFRNTSSSWDGPLWSIYLLDKTYPKWKLDDEVYKETSIPIIPASFRPKDLRKYFVLWEVRKWENVPKDPILLKRITNNLFIVLATWNLTPLERAFIQGR